MTNDWFMRVGDGVHFRSAISERVWGINSTTNTNAKGFIKSVVPGDRMWFLKTGGKIIAVATFVRTAARELGPLVAITPSNEERGWVKTEGAWDIDVYYENLYDLEKYELMVKGLGQAVIMRNREEKYGINLTEEYPRIVRYLKVVHK